VEKGIVAVDMGIGKVKVPTKITNARTFNLNHARTKIGQLQRCQRAGKELAEIQNHKPVQGPLILGE
jgi:hypothetical protein